MSWTRYCQSVIRYPKLGFSIDFSLMDIEDAFYASMQPKIDKAFAGIAELESGAIVNPDEQRMVGHYWLRNAALAPNDEIRRQITEPLQALKDFAEKVHTGQVTPPSGGQFEQLLLIGIGGSALGPQLVNDALGTNAKLPIHFFDNTDPTGMDRVLAKLKKKGLAKTLVMVISKSGGTAETRNGMLEAKAAYEAAGLSFGKHTIAITGEGSKLDAYSTAQGFIAKFPMEDWVGGRTSVMSTVGLVPAALQGIDIDAFLAGAAAMDAETRKTDLKTNAAMQLALAWYHVGKGRGEKDMVVLPYKDSLVLFSKYLQQLLMESLGKALDLDGNTVNQGIAVYGNKGSTDQHAYVQQLRDGVNNFFVTFIEVLKDRDAKSSLEVEPGITAGDFLQGFYLGTRDALSEKDRHSVTITLPDVSPRSLGMLIALYERVVGLYATLVGINAYHQPGVEAGKKAAGGVIALKLQLVAALKAVPGTAFTAEQLAAQVGAPEKTELAFKILEHLAANKSTGIKKRPKTPWFKSTYRAG